MRNTILFSFLFFVASVSAFAGTRLVFEDERPIFSGPSERYRIVAYGKTGSFYSASKKIITNSDGQEFYKILVVAPKKPKRVGYVPVESPVRIETGESEDVDNYLSLQQADTAFQIGVQAMKDYTFLWSFGVLKYPNDSLYLKAVVGQLLNKRTSSPLIGGEMGLDQPMVGNFSLFALFGGGVFFLQQKNLFFQGSKSINYYIQGGTGLRISADEKAAASFGILQTALLSPNASYVSPTFMLTLEVGL